ncbi:hypothetical protein ACFQZC_37870 [Streptacidiphilus monticola]
MTFPSPWHVQSIIGLVQDAEAHDILEHDPDLTRWTYPDAHGPAEGIPEYAFGPRKHIGRAPVRDFAGRRLISGRPAADFEPHPQLALLTTRQDRVQDWIRAGQALERVLLLATLRGLATSLTSHALEAPELRWLVRDPRHRRGTCKWSCASATARPDGPPSPPGRRNPDHLRTAPLTAPVAGRSTAALCVLGGAWPGAPSAEEESSSAGAHVPARPRRQLCPADGALAARLAGGRAPVSERIPPGGGALSCGEVCVSSSSLPAFEAPKGRWTAGAVATPVRELRRGDWISRDGCAYQIVDLRLRLRLRLDGGRGRRMATGAAAGGAVG